MPMNADNVLRVSMMGRMSVRWQGKPLELFRRTTDRMAQMFAMMALHPEGVQKDELIDALYGSVELNNRANALHVMLFRLRKRMAAAGMPDMPYLTLQSGVCRWSDQLVLRTDLMRMYEAYQGMKGAVRDEQALKYALKVCRAYGGEVLPQLANEYWVVGANHTAQNGYREAAGRAIEIYGRQGRYEGVIRAAFHAARYFPTEGWQKYQICALSKLGRHEEAKVLYRETAAMLRKRMNEEAAEKILRPMRELCRGQGEREEDRKDEALRKSLRQIIDHGGKFDLPCFCPTEAFTYLCRMMKQWNSSGSRMAYIAECRLSDEVLRIFGQQDEQETVMSQLGGVLAAQLSPDDVYTRSADRGYMMLLQDATMNRVREIKTKVEENCRKNLGGVERRQTIRGRSPGC